MNVYEEVIYKTRYAKYLPDEGRREEYAETVDRYWKAIREKALEHGYLFSKVQEDEIKGAILNREVLPSMRGFMTAGKALDRDEGAIYNCSYVGIDSVFAFQEILFTLMLGTGVGFSVEKQFVSKLPTVATDFRKDENVYVIQDSKEGWADAIGYVINALYDGVIPSVDYSLIRPKGAKLNTFGGRASGPEPLRNLIEFVAKIMMNAAGRQLRSIEVHDIVCMIASCVVSGGVRRSALISISDLDDIEMRDSKAGEWWKDNMQRALANNSAAYESKPSRDVFNTEWRALATSGSGERGIFNRYAARKKAEEIGRDLRAGFGTNPCGEISLNARQFCNLTSVQIRPGDTVEVLAKKVEIATILGTLQSLFDDYRYISKEWSKNQEEERLLGVSLSGIVDNALTNAADPGTTERLLKYLRNVALVTNEEWSANLNIRTSAAITCVKPEGTSSQMTGVSSGIHPAFAKYYIRRIRMDDKDPVSRFLIDQGVPYEVDTYNPSAYVFEFPIAASDFALVKDEFDAISQLELYKLYQTYWADHNVSNTVYVRADEWDKVGDWVYENFDLLCGVAFLPASEHTYIQAPYEEITFEKYKELEAKSLKSIDWTVLAMYEQEDTTVSNQTLSCSGGACDIMDVVQNKEVDHVAK